MNKPSINETSELANLRLRLRSALEFRLHEHGGVPSFVIENKRSTEFFQIGLPEYTFISLLDGNHSLQTALEKTENRLGADAFTLHDAIRTGHWLIESGLAETIDERGQQQPVSIEHLLERDEQATNQKMVSQLNPLFLKLPLGNPQPLLKALSPLMGWPTSKMFFFVWLIVMLVAAFRLLLIDNNWAESASGLFTARDWLWMFVTMLVLKVVHELAHGLSCNRFGGRVKEAGLVFILLVPIPYVDVTSSWGFASKWQRMAVAAAGMYAELFVAALAAIGWTVCLDPVWRFHFFNVMIVGSVMTIAFNANFLMRFDGYYLLADFLEVPNLYQRGQQFVNGLARRFLLGEDVALHRDNNLKNRKRSIVIAYGIASLLWRVLICVSLSILAAALFYGFGIALAMAGIAVWIGVPLVRFLKRMFDPISNQQINWKWIGAVSTPALAIATIAMVYLPWPFQVTAPAVVEFRKPAFVRADSAGQVRAVHVVAGQTVLAGEPLIDLQNQELETELRISRIELKQSLIKSRGYHQQRKVAAYQAELANRSAIEQRVAELERKTAALQISAATSGVVAGEDLAALPGQHVAKGTELLQVINESEKEVVAAIDQHDRKTFSAATQGAAFFLPSFGTKKFGGTLARVEPTATVNVDLRLTSYAGGSLDVRSAMNDQNQTGNQSSESVELIAPRFTGVMELDSADAIGLPVGTTGHVRLPQYNQTIAEHLILSTRRWLRNQFVATQ